MTSTIATIGDLYRFQQWICAVLHDINYPGECHSLSTLLLYHYRRNLHKLRVNFLKIQDNGNDPRICDVFAAIHNSKAQICNFDSLPLGLNMSITMSATISQRILNVKHVKSDDKQQPTDVSTFINYTILKQENDYSHFVIVAKIATMLADWFSFDNVEWHLVDETENLWHVIIEKRKIKKKSDYDSLVIQVLDYLTTSNHVVNILYFTDCRRFSQLPGISASCKLSNNIKYIYCTMFNQSIPVIDSSENLHNFSICFFYCLMFLYNYNLTIQNPMLGSPLNVLTGDKVIKNLNNFKEKVFETRGIRDSLFINDGIQLGGYNRCSEIMYPLKF